ncbi:MAG: hypothetical protein KF705_16765 [Phycisphaeraceae bacterium]|nr:hypothetical protein [Phycisphaeraceae bacterium]
MNRISRQRCRALERKQVARQRRAVASVLAMMLLILFGSLVTAMAIASKGNIRTADTQLHVMRALGAAETGLAVAEQRLMEAASRFVVSRGVIDGDAGWNLWIGNLGSLGTVEILDAPSGFNESGSPDGLAEAVANRHAADVGIVIIDGLSVPVIGPAASGADLSVYRGDYWIYTPLIGLESRPEGERPVSFQIVYAPLQDGATIRAIVTGYDFDNARQGRPITRTVSRDFTLTKRINHAIVSNSRIMLGRNVHVEGDLGARFMGVEHENGHPIVARSDFYGLAPALDTKLEAFYAGVAQYDVDGDNRLRVGHPVESLGIPMDTDTDGDTVPDGSYLDVTGDGYVDEFDIFIRHFDRDGDGRVTLSSALTVGTPAEGREPEFVGSGGTPINDDLALLIDSSNPDRNKNGIYGFIDENGNGVWDPDTESLLDFDPVHVVYRDQVLGYRDGFIDKMDRYTKIRGRLAFKVSADAWVANQGSWRNHIEGGINAGDRSPVQFSMNDTELPGITASSFTSTESALRAAANGESFARQVADNLGVSVESLPGYVEAKGSGTPRYYRVDPDNDGDGRPDNWATAYFEQVPFNSPSYSDWYYRPVYENMVFKDVIIPIGTNALFKNCTFAGVTYVRTHTGNTHANWTLYGKMVMDSSSGRPKPDRARSIYGDDPHEENGADAPDMLPVTAIPPQQWVLLADEPLDKGDLLQSQVGSVSATSYAQLPAPLVIDGKRVTDTRAYSNNIRFHDCTFVGSIVSDTPTEYTQVRNKFQFTGATRFLKVHPEYPDDARYNPESSDIQEILKSSMMLPNYSVDIGNFNSPPTQNVQLQGAVIAGVLDVRGTATIDGALVLTFSPVRGEGPMKDSLGNPVGNPAGFNATLGYFGPDDGDSESLDPATLPEFEGVKIVGWDLDGDGIADIGPTDTPTAAELENGAVPVPFHGLGRVTLRFNPDMMLPDGIMLPLQVRPSVGTYREGKR